ncbi:hypothetical protein NKR23_g11893 [Pleurostoma richardsiae]|uniref:Uncharacterized protein n=1 Tax=Pleurostoma richardsiae TaxID=41990 RepID=A0AA38R6Y2_9PEZI|nr:hypothetical protein NKR23_g11893 [Pleurostoma richardsiae]
MHLQNHALLVHGTAGYLFEHLLYVPGIDTLKLLNDEGDPKECVIRLPTQDVSRFVSQLGIILQRLYPRYLMADV